MTRNDASTVQVEDRQDTPSGQEHRPVEPIAADESRPCLWSSSSPSPTSASPMPARPQETTSTPACCQYPGCSKSAKYGPQDEPPIACQAHKRTGQYRFNRHGELLMATRDGEVAVAPGLLTGRSKGHSAGGSIPISSRRKKSAKLPPTMDQKLKRANRPALISGDTGSSEPPSRPCLFPGCDAPPQYGLPRAVRAVYCFSHKKGPMVKVSPEALLLQSQEGDCISPALPTAESNKTQKRAAPAATITASGKKKAKKAKKAKTARRGTGSVDTDGVCFAGLVGEQKVEKSSHGKLAGGAAMEGSAIPAAAAAAAATTISTTSIPTPTAGSQDGTSAVSAKKALPPPPAPPSVSRLADTSEMSPSAEILVLRQAREAAKMDAEASGGGRRPRAPSRRALEASGRMKGGGAQWMTRERKAEEARVKKELREQRRQYRAAGLNVGVVIEAYVAPETGGGAGGEDGGGDRGAGEVRGQPGWQKVSPALLVASSPLPPMEQNVVGGETGRAS